MILACWLVGATSVLRRRVGAAFVAIALAGHVVAFIAISRRLGMGRVQGLDVLDFVLHPRWEPGLPAGLLLAGMVVAVVGVGVIAIPAVLRDAGTAAPVMPTAPSDSASDRG